MSEVVNAKGRAAISRATASTGLLVAALSIAAAVIHFAVVPEHLEEYVPFGLAFMGLGTFQLVTALAGFRSPSALRYAVIFVNAGAIATWLVSRSIGLPLGPEPWHPEAIAVPDLISSAFELVLIALLAPGLHKGRRFSLRPTSVPVVTITTMVLIGLLTIVAIVAVGMPSDMAAQ